MPLCFYATMLLCYLAVMLICYHAIIIIIAVIVTVNGYNRPIATDSYAFEHVCVLNIAYAQW